MSRKLTSRSSLENLKREAKRWLKELRAGETGARTRLANALSKAPAEPTLRDVQHALAREHGFDGWTALAAAVEKLPRSGGLTELLAAAERGDAARVREILDVEPALVNERGTLEGHTGLRTALHFGVAHADVVRVLLEHGADPDIRDEGDNAVPLHFAAERLDMPVIRMLVEHGSEMIGAGDDHELEIIGWAACFNPPLGISEEERADRRREVVAYLLAHGSPHNILSAVAMGDVDAIRRIASQQPQELERPMDRTNQHRRPLHLAVISHRPESLNALLELAADPNTVDAAGLTPLDHAGLRGEKEMADALIAHGATINLPAAVTLDRDLDRVLAENPGALQRGGKYESLIVRAAEDSAARVVETLLRHGADPNTPADASTAIDGAWGYTALHAAAYQGKIDVIDVLLRHGANPDVVEDKYLGTPADWANHFGHAEARDRILEGPIGFFDAVRYDRVDRLREIFDRNPSALSGRLAGMLPKKPPREQWGDVWVTPLALAVAREKVDAVRALLELGAEVDVRDANGKSLREYAAEGGNVEIIRLLEQAAPKVNRRASVESETHEQLIARFLSNACPDHHVRGGASHIVARQTANQILAAHPDLARDNIYTAVVCGDIDTVRRILSERPELARQRGGPKGSDEAAGEDFVTEATPAAPPFWDPLLYLCFTRIDDRRSSDNAVEIAKLLLANGADPNTWFMAGNSRYSPLTGVIGEGEENRPAHPRRNELVKLLLEHGAFPFDVQVFYNIHFNGRMLWFLELIYEESVKRGRLDEWKDPRWSMIDMGGYGKGAEFILRAAARHEDDVLADWAIAHGAGPEFDPRVNPAVRDRRPDTPEMDLHRAASLDDVATIARLLDQGVDINCDDPLNRKPSGTTPLHSAAWADSPNACRLLIERGADVDRYDDMHGATPLGYAVYGNKTRAIEVLKHYGNDLWNLVLLGSVDRVRASLEENPKRARAMWPDERITPIMRLPGDEDTAIEIVELFLSHGADPTVKNSEGFTAADIAERRGMFRVAALLRE